jgi:hypothetical protein
MKTKMSDMEIDNHRFTSFGLKLLSWLSRKIDCFDGAVFFLLKCVERDELST